MLTKVNLISMSINQASRSLIKKGTVITENMLNMVEMAFGAYDPCFDCNTHPLPAKMPEQATIRNAIGKPVEVLKQFC